MILNFLKKIPAGMMVVPLLLGSIITTIFPNIWEIGGLTAAVFSSVGTNTLLGAQLFCMGTALQVKDMPAVLKRGGVLLIAKFAIGAGLGILVGKLFGDAGFFGLSTLAIVSAVTNSNGSVYLTLMGNYGTGLMQDVSRCWRSMTDHFLHWWHLARRVLPIFRSCPCWQPLYR